MEKNKVMFSELAHLIFVFEGFKYCQEESWNNRSDIVFDFAEKILDLMNVPKDTFGKEYDFMGRAIEEGFSRKHYLNILFYDLQDFQSEEGANRKVKAIYDMLRRYSNEVEQVNKKYR